MIHAVCENLILARNNGDEKSPWMQLIVLVVFFGIYGLRAFVKIKKDDPPRSPLNRPASRPRPVARPPLRSAGNLQQRHAKLKKEPIHPSAELKKLPLQHAERMKSPLTAERKLGRIEPAVSEAESPPTEDGFAEPVELDFSKTSSLREAFLYHEILGKPVAMRQGSQDPAV